MKKMTAFVLTAMAIMVFAFCMPAKAAEDTAVSKILPELSLRVLTEEAGDGNINVTYIAKLSNHRLLLTSNGSIRPAIIDFYTGNTELTLYPNEYIGKALVNINGVAELKVIQKPGEYVGGAVGSNAAGQKVFSNIVIYKLPPIAALPEIKLEVIPKAADDNTDANVTYIARLTRKDISDSLKAATIDFYTGNPDVDAFPNQYLGSAEVDKNGVAQLKVYQEPGEYAGGAISAKTSWGDICSNVVTYKVPAVIGKPEIKLEVIPRAVTANASDKAINTNVTFIARLVRNGFAPDDSTKPVTLDFYTGSPVLAVYPNQYLGSAVVDENGIAQLKVYQEPGEYAGGAILSGASSDEIYSNVVTYKVPEIPPVKPLLKLEVFAGAPSVSYNSDAILPKGNVTYKATLINSRYAVSASDDEDISIPITKRTVSFYTASSDSELPDELIGSAEIDSAGVAKISFYQEPGKYTGAAVYIIDNSGEKIYSNIVKYGVPSSSNTANKRSGTLKENKSEKTTMGVESAKDRLPVEKGTKRKDK